MVWKALCAAPSVCMPYQSATSGVSSVIPDFARVLLIFLNHLWSFFELRSSPSPENLGSFRGFGREGLAGPGSAIVFLGGRGGGSGSSGGEISFLGLLVLSGLIIKALGTDCSLDCICKGSCDSGRLLNSPTTLGARQRLAEGHAGVPSVSETSCAATLTAATCSRTLHSSLWIICSALGSSSEFVSRSPGSSAVCLGASAGPGVGPGLVLGLLVLESQLCLQLRVYCRPGRTWLRFCFCLLKL